MVTTRRTFSNENRSVHDRTVAQDYYTAMTHIEQNLNPTADPTAETDETGKRLNAAERAQLQELLKRLADPHLGLEARLVLVDQMQRLLQRAEGSAE